MRITGDQARLLALCKVKGANWYLLAREAQRHGGLDRLWSGEDATESSADALKTVAAIRAAHDDLDRYRDEAAVTVEKAARADATLCTVTDDCYPATLRLIF